MSSVEMFEVEENRPSAVLVVIDKIKELLIEKKLQPGEMIPSESVLAESLKVGRGTVREAFKILSAYGVVEIRRGTGTFVSSASNRRLFDHSLFQILVQDRDYTVLMQVREILEAGIVKLVIEQATEADLEDLDRVAHHLLAVLSASEPVEESAKHLDLEYHRLLGKYSHNPIIENIYEFVIELFAPTIHPVHAGVHEVHRDLHDAIMHKDLEAALSALRRHTTIWVNTHGQGDD